MLPETNTEVTETTENVSHETQETQDTQTVEYPKWMAQNAGENKTNEKLSGFKTTDEISNAYLKVAEELNSLKDGKKFIPGENATDEEKRAYLTSIGVPEDAKSYKKVDSSLPDGVGFTEEQFESLRETAFRDGWTEKQFEGYQEWSNKEVLARQEARNAKIASEKEAVTQKLKNEWADNYEANVQYMKKGIASFGGDAFLAKLGEAGNIPEVINFLVEKGRSGKNDSFLDSDLGSTVSKNPNQISYPSMKGM